MVSLLLLMPTTPQLPGLQPAAASPTLAVNLDTADVKQLAYSLVRAAEQPQLFIDCKSLALQRTLGVCEVISRLLLLRQTGASIALSNTRPGLRRYLQLLGLSPLFSLAA